MKNFISQSILVSLLWLSFSSFAFTKNPYWVLEKDSQKGQNLIVSYYNADNQLVYQEKLEQKKFKLSATQLRQLDKKLATYLKNQVMRKGFWVIESNVNTRDFTIVRFYDWQKQLLHEEKLSGKYLKLNAQTQRKLNKALDAFLDKQIIKLPLK